MAEKVEVHIESLFLRIVQHRFFLKILYGCFILLKLFVKNYSKQTGKLYVNRLIDLLMDILYLYSLSKLSSWHNEIYLTASSRAF